MSLIIVIRQDHKQQQQTQFVNGGQSMNTVEQHTRVCPPTVCTLHFTDIIIVQHARVWARD